MNIYVYLHHPGQFYDSDSKTKIYVNQGRNSIDIWGSMPFHKFSDRLYL